MKHEIEAAAPVIAAFRLDPLAQGNKIWDLAKETYALFLTEKKFPLEHLGGKKSEGAKQIMGVILDDLLSYQKKFEENPSSVRDIPIERLRCSCRFAAENFNRLNAPDDGNGYARSYGASMTEAAFCVPRVRFGTVGIWLASLYCVKKRFFLKRKSLLLIF